MKVVVTVVGKDRVGIIAMVSNILAENKVNILNVNQNIMDGFFNMVMIAEMTDNAMALADLQQVLKEKGFTVVSIGNGETSDREQTIIMAPLRSVDLFYGMPFPCVIMVSEDKEQATVYIGRDFAP